MPTVWLLKVRLVGERLTPGAVPVPLRLTLCGLLPVLSVMLSKAVRLPVVEGVNNTAIVQCLPAARELAHVLVSAKSLALAPASAMLEMLKAEVPVLLRVVL